jgi:hypothetical protein
VIRPWLSALFVVVFIAACCSAQDLYVSPRGDDANPGTADRPVLTLHHARDLAREVKARGPLQGDLVIHLAVGAYRPAEPVVFDPADSGENGHDIVYAGPDDGFAILSGGIEVTGWKLSDPQKNIWSAPAPSQLKNTRQLYVNGVRAARARGLLPVTLTEDDHGYTADSDAMSHWRNPSDIEFVYTGGNSLWGLPSEGMGPWTEPRCPVAWISGTDIVMAQPCWDNSTKRVMLDPSFHVNRAANLVGPAHFGKRPMYVENAYELLATPGQWYFDRAAGTVYYIPRPGQDMSKCGVEAPILEKLIDIRGSEAQPVHHLVFKHIQFSYATWLAPCTGEGFSEIQANYRVTGPDGYTAQGLCHLAPGGKCPFGAWTKTPGNVSATHANHIQFIRDAFVHLGAAGLELGHGSQFDTVEGCVFTDVSANGLELGGVDLPEATPSQLTADNRIANNHFYNLPAEYHGGVAICVGYTQRTSIEHNQIDHVPYSGISLGWGGWLDKIKQPGVGNNSQDAMVAHNLIFDHLLLLADGGGIYTQGLTGPDLPHGQKVIGNVVRDQYGSGHAIYSDNGSSNMTIRGNVIFNTNFDNWGTAHANYYDNSGGKTRDPFIIQDNYWQQGDPDMSRDNVTKKNNRLIASLDHAPREILDVAGLEAPFKDILKMSFGELTTPASPQRVCAVPVEGGALVAWNPPTFDGGSPIQSYTVLASTGQKSRVSVEEFRAAGYAKVSGLGDGSSCTFAVTANNAQGPGEPSLPSPAITVSQGRDRLPAAPTIRQIYAGDSMISVHFQAPARSGPILAYAFTVNPGGRRLTFSGRGALTLGGTHTTFVVIDGLENGKRYTVDLAAVNPSGEGEHAISRSVLVGAAK